MMISSIIIFLKNWIILKNFYVYHILCIKVIFSKEKEQLNGNIKRVITVSCYTIIKILGDWINII